MENNGGIIDLSDSFLERIAKLEQACLEQNKEDNVIQDVKINQLNKEIESLKGVIDKFREDNDSMLYTALSAAQAEMPVIDKDASSFGKQTYATLANIIRITKPILAKYGLSVLQTFEDRGVGGEILATTLCHKSGQSVSSYKILPSTQYDEKGEVLNGLRSEGKAITYLRRYCYVCVLGLATEDVD